MEMENCSAEKEEGTGLHSWPVCMAEGISDLSIASFRKQHSVKPNWIHRHLFKESLFFSGEKGREESDVDRVAQI